MKSFSKFSCFVMSFAATCLFIGQHFIGEFVYSPSEKPILFGSKVLAAELNWNWNSVPTFGHAFKKHGQGSSITNSLKGTAAGTKKPQGQWLNNDSAASLLKDLRPTLSGPATTIIPKGLGQVINPDGSITPATHAVVVPIPNSGYKTAYPFVPGKPDYNED
jgi:hypothetical protein